MDSSNLNLEPHILLLILTSSLAWFVPIVRLVSFISIWQRFRKLDDFRLSSAYVTQFLSYLTNRLSHARCRGAVSTPYELLFGVPQGSVLGPLISVFSKTLCAVLSGIESAFSLSTTPKYTWK
jgi:hypothetical protein